jgi:hypothetical protein
MGRNPVILCIVKNIATTHTSAGDLTMTRATIAGAACVSLVLLALVACYPAQEHDVETAEPASPAMTPSTSPADVHRSVIYGRITDGDGATYEGRLRWGRDQEAFWGDYFNGLKDGNPWALYSPLARPSNDGNSIEIFGFKLGGDGQPNNLRRLFMARFGDVARIEAHFRTVEVTLKSGTVFTLDRFAAGDIDDGVRVWDSRRGVLDLDTRQIRTIEFLATARPASAPNRLYGTVQTRQGEFSGFIQWDEYDGLATDELDGRTTNGEVRLRYDTIRSIARHSTDSARVTMLDGRELVLTGTREAGSDNRGIYVDDLRYGRVLISWRAFARLDFSPGGSGPAYSDFPPGRPLSGSVTTRDGRRLSGRLVYDLDESETTDTLDAALEGVDYNIPFSLITSIVPRGNDSTAGRATVILHDGQPLPLELTGDLGDKNAGMLIFVDGRGRPEYVPWSDVEHIDFEGASR